MNDAPSEIFGKALLGGAVGFALFFVVAGLGTRGLGKGGGNGPGNGAGKCGEEGPVPAPPLSRPKDVRRLSFVMIAPTGAGMPMGFVVRDGDPSKIYAVKELIARVKEGGRTDVELRVRGNVIQRAWKEAQRLIEQAGLVVGLVEASQGLPVSAGAWSGDIRGHYGRRFG